jgi:N-acetylmuramoyl-L-alanine amidase
MKRFSSLIPALFLIFVFFVQGPLQAQSPTPDRPAKAALNTLSLDETLRDLEAQLRWDPFFQAGVLAIREHRVSFRTGVAGDQGFAMIDSREVLPVSQPFIEGGLLRFPEDFVSSLRGALGNSLPEDRTRFRIAAIIIDPGHGGRDAGAIGTHTINGKQLRVVEKDLTLKVSLSLHARLSEAYPDKRVLLTRAGDTFPSLEDRVKIANAVPLKDNEAIIYISIHANASLNPNGRGYEVWYLTPEYRRTLIDQEKYADTPEIVPILNLMLEEEFTSESTIMARFILNRFTEILGDRIPSRGLKAEEWFVVRNARMPSVLVEMGFVTNQEDALLMSDEAYLKNLSEALYKGITDFVAVFERSGGFTAIP